MAGRATSHCMAAVVVLASLLLATEAACPFHSIGLRAMGNRKLHQQTMGPGGGGGQQGPQQGPGPAPGPLPPFDPNAPCPKSPPPGAGAPGFTAPSTCTPCEWSRIIHDISQLVLQPACNSGFCQTMIGPNFIRLAFHLCGTWSSNSETGGCNGAYMQFTTDSPDTFDGNDGLQTGILALAPIKVNHPCVTLSDLWSLSGAVAARVMGLPQINWRAGRLDATRAPAVTPVFSSRLPSAEFNAAALEYFSGQMNLTLQETVALIGGGHSVGHAFSNHKAGYNGSWVDNPNQYTNQFFKDLAPAIEHIPQFWAEFTVPGTGEKEFVATPARQSSDGFQIFRLISDIALIEEDSPYIPFVQTYAADQAQFFRDFAAVFQKVSEFGVRFNPGSFAWDGTLG